MEDAKALNDRLPSTTKSNGVAIAVRRRREFTADCAGCDATTGFDRLMDTHFGRRLLASDRSLDGALAAAEALGSAHTVWSKGDIYFLYVAAPSGFVSAQLTGGFDDPPTGTRMFDTCVAY